MDFLDLARQRHSVRHYLPRQVEEEKLHRILEAGRIAPTAVNNQPQRFVVIRSEEGLKRLHKGADVYGAPLAILVCGDHNAAWIRPFDKKHMVDIDATIATTHMMLEATEQGLGSCWITYFDPGIIRQEFNLPPHVEPVNILALGYAAEEPPSSGRHARERRPLEDFLRYETF